MSKIQRMLIEEDGQIIEVFMETKDEPSLPETQTNTSTRPGEMGITDDAIVKMKQARTMIRGYTSYVLSAFKEFGTAKVEEVSLQFGLKFGAKAGIPYITEGSSDCNIVITVKCTFPDS